jgi:hypothetical protein
MAIQDMRKLQTISFFLLLVFSTQLVPVSMVGSFLYSNQAMEELPHGASASNQGGHAAADSVWDAYTGDVFARHLPDNDLLDQSGPDPDSSVHSRTADDIQTPPPNC